MSLFLQLFREIVSDEPSAVSNVTYDKNSLGIVIGPFSYLQLIGTDELCYLADVAYDLKDGTTDAQTLEGSFPLKDSEIHYGKRRFRDAIFLTEIPPGTKQRRDPAFVNITTAHRVLNDPSTDPYEVDELGTMTKLAEQTRGGPAKTKTVFEEAEGLVNGPRQQSYGPPTQSLKRIAIGWSLILHHNVTPREVALMMAQLKLVRDTKQPGLPTSLERDNLVDVCGYIRLSDLCGFIPNE